MGKNNSQAAPATYAEAGLEDIKQEAAEVEAGMVETSGGSDSEDDLQQVGGLEPVDLFYRMKPPKTAPKNPFKVFEKGETITGVYERSFISGKYKRSTYIIRLVDGRLIGLPGTGSLARGMDKLAEGSKVKIIYQGVGTIKGGEWAGNDAYNFVVYGNKLKAA